MNNSFDPRNKLEARYADNEALERGQDSGSWSAMMRTVKTIPALAVVLTCLIGFDCESQSPNTSTVTVVVTDETGAVLPGADISIANAEIGAARSVPSGPDGSAVIPGLSVTGPYDVTITRAGFNTEVVKDVVLRLGETAR